MQQQSPKQIILHAMRLVELDESSEIRLKSNGGNSILIVCAPQQEATYIHALEKSLASQFEILDLNKILLEFIDEHRDIIDMSFDLLKGSVHQIFKSPDGEGALDLFNQIMDTIQNVYKKAKTPVLINVGTLNGTGIENIHIMEHKTVMNAKTPLIVLYPGTYNNDNLLFLSKRQASKYRCFVLS